jgi:hypothetical protein
MLRLACSGQVLTEDQQDPESSHGWQVCRRRGVGASLDLAGPSVGVLVALPNVGRANDE